MYSRVNRLGNIPLTRFKLHAAAVISLQYIMILSHSNLNF